MSMKEIVSFFQTVIFSSNYVLWFSTLFGRRHTFWLIIFATPRVHPNCRKMDKYNNFSDNTKSWKVCIYLAIHTEETRDTMVENQWPIHVSITFIKCSIILIVLDIMYLTTDCYYYPRFWFFVVNKHLPKFCCFSLYLDKFTGFILFIKIVIQKIR